MSAKRRCLSKRTRFEILKRDRFTCQYCGAKAPDVVLHVDHIEPVSAGGTNDLPNLITACQNCNVGKSNRPLSETHTLRKQRAQLELLQDRREFMRMHCQWQEELARLPDEEVARIEELFTKRVRPAFARDARSDARNWMKAHGFERVLQSMLESLGRHRRPSKKPGEKSRSAAPSAEVALDHVIRRIRCKDLERRDPDRARFLYVKSMLRNRFSYISWSHLEQAIESWRGRGLSAEDLAAIARRSATWASVSEAAAAKRNETKAAPL